MLPYQDTHSILSATRNVSDNKQGTHFSFSKRIEALSQNSSDHDAYPRPDLLSLSHYLRDSVTQQRAKHSPETASTSEGDILNTFAVTHDIKNGTFSSFTASPAGLANFTASNHKNGPSILFIRGYGSPEWLNAVGDMWNISPELYRRHLQYMDFSSRGRNLYSSPSLPSSSARVFQLIIPTICTRNVSGSGYEPEDLESARRLEKEAMGRYFNQLRSKANLADSVVRKCLLLSRQYYVVEQMVTIQIGPPEDDWHVVVWLDSGRDLSRSVKGPWCPHPGTRPWETYFFPVIVHPTGDENRAQSQRQSSAPLDNLNSPIEMSRLNYHGRDGQMEEWNAAQNLSLFPFQYGSFHDKDLARQDALYALREVFQFSASAEVQFLNLLESRIEHEISFVRVQDDSQYYSVSLLNLKYVKAQLTSHVQSLRETVSLLQSRHNFDWPRITDQGQDSAKLERMANLLLADFEYLFYRAETLATQCDEGMTTLVNSSVLEESRRSANMAMKVQRLTIIATVFIPLSFVCAVWGMNLKVFGSGDQPIWVCFISAVPIVLLALLIYYWDGLIRSYQKAKSTMEKMSEGLHDIKS